MKRFTAMALMAIIAFFSFAQPAPKFIKNPAGMKYETLTRNMQNKVNNATALGNIINGQFRPFEKAPTPQRVPSVKNLLMTGIQTHAESGKDLIKDTPEGTMTTYMRSGQCYYTNDGNTYADETQTGIMHMVTANDGKTVYIKELVSATTGIGTWVKGEISSDGKTISIPTGQNVAWFEGMQSYMRIEMLDFDPQSRTFVENKDAQYITLSIEGNTMTLNGADHNHILGLVYSNNNQWALYGDFNTTYELFTDKPVVAPEGLKTKKYLMTCSDYEDYTVYYQIEIGFDGNNAYLKGMCPTTAPDAWVKGTRREDGSIHIPSVQFAGFYDNKYAIYFVGGDMVNDNLTTCDMVLNYDPTTDLYYTNNWILENTRKDIIYIVNMFNNISMAALPDIQFTTDVITERPKGELKIYNRQGWGIFPANEQLYKYPQDDFIMQVVYCSDGKTVYMKNPISQIKTGSWVKGTIEGNKIKMPLYQCVSYYAENRMGMITIRVAYNARTRSYEPDFDAKEMTFTIDPTTETISLDNTGEKTCLYGLLDTSTFQWTMYGDYGSVYVPLKLEATVIPEHLTKEKWSIHYDYFGFKHYGFVNVATDGHQVYIDHLPNLNETAVIVGTIKEDGRVYFKGDQYLGFSEQQDALTYFGGGTYEIEEFGDPQIGITKLFNFIYDPNFSMVYDAEKKTLKGDNMSALIFNVGLISKGVVVMDACGDPDMKYYKETSSQPADPRIEEYTEYPNEDLIIMKLNIPTYDNEGNFIDPAKISYQIFTKKNDTESVYTFLRTQYPKLEENLQVMPYEYSDMSMIGWGGNPVFIYNIDIDDIAVQSINSSCGIEKRSNKMWYSKTSGIDQTTDIEKKIINVTYYNLSGIEINQPSKGIYIKTVTYADGSRETQKMIGL